MRFTNLLLLLPTEVAPLLLVLAGIAVMFGRKQLATTLFIGVGTMAFAPAILGPLLAGVPTWLLTLALPAMGVLLVGTVVTMVFGNRVWEVALGHLIARFLAPLWLIATAFLVLYTFF